MHPTVKEIEQLLQHEGVIGVEKYSEKLAPNWKTPAVYRDLLSEAYAALMFRRSGFEVRMRESPDLQLTFDGHVLGAEVKHFHRKPQDDIDDQQMGAEFIPIGDTVATEGKEGEQQVVAVALKKFSQLFPDRPNVLVIESSSENCIQDTEILTAVNYLSDKDAPGKNGLTGRLNAVMLMSPHYDFSKGRSVFFFEVHLATALLPRDLRRALECITEWKIGVTAAH